MEVTKYEHACLCIDKDGKTIIVDPGILTNDFSVPDTVVAIVITHEHPDHFDPTHISDIIDDNPGAIIMAPPAVTSQLSSYETRPVKAGDNFTIEGIEFEFFGGEHARIYKDLPIAQNIGVLIDERLYYPGDSFVVPDKSVDTLALPAGAPWMKVSEAIDFLLAVAPRYAFPTHDAVLSKDGQSFNDMHFKRLADEHDIIYERIDGQTIEVK